MAGSIHFAARRLGVALTLLACHPASEPAPLGLGEEKHSPPTAVVAAPIPAEPRAVPIAAPEPALGVADRGIFSDLDARVQLPAPLAVTRVLIDEHHQLVVVYAGAQPVKVYPLLDASTTPALALAGYAVHLRAGDRHELQTVLVDDVHVDMLAPERSPAPGDRDDDGIPDPLDVEIGALKTTLNAAHYDQRYVTLSYPGGDVPRELEACTDVIVRALRNAGLDLQVELHEDIARHPRRYPMVARANASIDHRRVRTLLPYFRAHWLALPDDDALQPGDVVFMDTIADREGPDHIGVVGHLQGERGRLLVANNWTDGHTTAYMDLLDYVPVTDRFRMPPPHP